MTNDRDASLDVYLKAVLGRKASGIVVLDVADLTSVAETFFICSGRSNRQVTAIADFIEATLKKDHLRPLSVEGKKEGQWVLMDYGHVVIHVFYEPVRQFYDLEGLWSDARRVQSPLLAQADPTEPDWDAATGDIIDEFIE